ncbi:MAG TPA: tetratricopeptide repeat protein [Thermoanaerobaculia bacterium]|nr:tetratricopeptide repeat protein [Thermoanaerobaculia bacterium]
MTVLMVVLMVATAGAAGAVPTSVTIPNDVQPLAVEDVLALTPEMRQWVHDEVPRGLSPVERLDLLVRRLQAADGAALRYDAWFTASAAESFAAHKFNCLSFSHLLIAMAREVGLNAYYLEARYRERYDREGDLVLLAGHITVGWGDGPRRWVVDFGNQAKLDRARVQQLDDRRALALHYANLGAADLRRGDARSALRALATAVEVDPRAGGAWVNLGVALRRRGDFAGAEAAYRKAIEVDSQLVPGFANLYSLLRATGRTHEAKELVAAIMRLPRKDPWLLLAMGDECLQARDLRGAERLFRQARRELPDDAAPAAALASWALAKGDAAQARKWVQRAEGVDAREPRLISLRNALGLPQPPPLQAGSADADATAVTVPPVPAATPPPSPN